MNDDYEVFEWISPDEGPPPDLDIKTHTHGQILRFYLMSHRMTIWRCLECYAEMAVDDHAAVTARGDKWVEVNFRALPPGVKTRIRNVPREST